jgi:molybdate transport system ATP-binding protein
VDTLELDFTLPLRSFRLELALAIGRETFALVGPSGAGKTSILRAVAGLACPQRGRITLDGRLLFDAAAKVDRPSEERRVGFVFQDYALFPHMTVEQNVAYGGRTRTPELLERFRISHLAKARPHELSGGERQRVGLARALARDPDILLLDEPLSALDAPARAELRVELRRTLVRAGLPAIVVTHDRTEALALGDRIVVLVGGAVRQVGAVGEVFGAPSSAEVAKVVGTENVLPVRLARRGDGLATVRAGPVELVGVDPGGLEDEAWAVFRAEEIVLEEAPGAQTSAQNLLAGTVTDRADEGPLVRVRIDCGIPIVALVTRASAERLRLAPGRAIAALVKAPSVRLVPRGP